MTRILIVSEVFWPENFLVNDLAREWQSAGYEVHVLSQYPSYPQSYVFDGYRNVGCTVEDWDGIRIHRFPFIEGYRDSKTRKFANYLEFVIRGKKLACDIAKGFDLIFVSQTGPLTVALPALAAGRRHNIPVAIWTQDIWPDVLWSYGVPECALTRFIAGKFISRVYSGCSHIFVSSRDFAGSISRYCDRKTVYTPNWLRPSEEEKSRVRLDESRFNFTFTGNVSLYQNLANTVLGFGKAGLDNCTLNIVGDGSYLEQLKAVVRENGIKDVVFHGRVPYSEVNDILCQSRVLVLPLVANEGVMKTEPFKLQSYLHSGRPVLGILGGSGAGIILENSLGVVAPPDDVDAIASAFGEAVDFARKHSEEVKLRADSLMRTRFCRESIINTFNTELGL